jgi:hypothetical protein
VRAERGVCSPPARSTPGRSGVYAAGVPRRHDGPKNRLHLEWVHARKCQVLCLDGSMPFRVMEPRHAELIWVIREDNERLTLKEAARRAGASPGQAGRTFYETRDLTGGEWWEDSGTEGPLVERLIRFAPSPTNPAAKFTTEKVRRLTVLQRKRAPRPG